MKVLSGLITTLTIQFWHITVEEIAHKALSMNLKESDREDGTIQKKVSHDATLAYIEDLIQYLEGKVHVSLCHKIVLQTLQSTDFLQK